MAHCGVWLLINGIGPGYLWPAFAARVHIDPQLPLALSIFGTFAFAAYFLSTARVPRAVWIATWVCSGIGAVLMVAGLIIPPVLQAWFYRLHAIYILPSFAVMMVLTAIALFRGEPAARPLMLTWLALAASVTVGWLRNKAIIPSNVLTLNGQQLGSIVEMLVFSAMLLDRLGRLQKEKETLQQAALNAAQANEAILERRVADRTAALAAANARLLTIVGSAPFPIVLTREGDGRVLFANRRAGALFGLPVEDLIGRPARGWLIDASATDDSGSALDDRGVIENREAELRRGDGERFWAALSVVRIDYDGEAARLVALNDITRHKLVEQELHRTAALEAAAAERERAARRLQQQFVALVSHEFRSPLAVIDGAAQNIAAEEPGNRDRVERIRISVRRLFGMIEACLVDERVEDGELQLECDTFDLRVLLETAVELVESASPDHVFELDLPLQPVMLHADLHLTEIAISNLLENAVKYSPAGSAVVVAVTRTEEYAELTVADEGAGVPEGERDRIFDKYYRSGAATEFAGSGLGLHLVRAIVDAHGGMVSCTANRPRGSRFTIRLPFDAEADREAAE